MILCLNWIFIAIFLIIHLNKADVIFYDSAIDHIEIIFGENFTEIIYNSDRLTVMEFYAHWCAFSKRFIPHWKNFASESLLWQNQVLRVAAIDCADARNMKICDENDVLEYPVFRWFQPHVQKIRGIDAENEKSRSEEFMRTAITFLEGFKHPTESWPYLEPYE